MNKHERNYSTTEKEGLAIVWSISVYQSYIFGRKFEIVTDHKAWKWLVTTEQPTERLARWMMKLQQYDYTVRDQPRVQHQNADALS